MIARAEAIRIIDSGSEFSLKVVTCDRKRRTGGEMKYFPRVQKLNLPFMATNSDHAYTFSRDGKKKHPRHSENATRNLFDFNKQKPVKIHIHLILLINGEAVVW